MNSPSEELEKKATSKGRLPALTLLSAVLLIAGLWGIALPRVAELPALEEKINHLEKKGIDSGAIFYSDHPNAFKN